MATRGFVSPPGSSGEDGRGTGDTLLITETNLRDELEALGFCEAAYQHGSRQKGGLEKNWHNTLQFAQGNQYIAWDPAEQLWKEMQLPEHRVRYKANMVGQYLMTRGSKILRDRPKPHVNPATGEPEDAEIAQVSTRVGQHLWKALNVNGSVLPAFVMDVLTMGTGFLKAFWDPDRGPRVSFEADDAELVDPEILEGAFGGVPENERDYAIGDAVLESVSPFNIYPAPGHTRWEEMPWLMDCRRQTLDDVRNRYPGKGRRVTAEGAEQDSVENIRSRVQEYSGSGLGATGSMPGIPTVLVKELWVRPCRKYPKGYHLVATSDVVLVSEPLPKWCMGEIPYYIQMDRRIPERLWGVSTADDVRDINKARNLARSQLIENAKISGNPPIRMPLGSRLKKEHLHGGPGAVWEYSAVGAAHKPEFVQPPTLPDYVKSMPQELSEDAMYISGLNEPTMRAQAPRNVRTASGLAALLKVDDSRQAVFMQEIEECIARAVSRLLTIVALEYEEERLIRVVGEKQQVVSFFFRGGDLMGKSFGTPGVNYFDVEVRVESGHRSKEALQQFLMQAAQMKLINIENEEERRKLLRMMEVGAPDDAVFGDITVAEAQQLQENSWMANDDDESYQERVTSSDMGPHPWDDDPTHLAELLRFMRSTSFYKVPRERWARFQIHEKQHEKAILRKQMEQAAEMMEAQMAAGVMPPQGGPEGQGGPPPGGPQAGPMPGGPTSMSGAPEEPKLPSPPNLEKTQFAGV